VRRLVHPRRLKPVASADRSDDEMQGGMLRVAALLDEIFGGLLARSDLDKPRLLGGFVFTKMGTETALTVMHLEHDQLLSAYLPNDRKPSSNKQ
jgi:hypothetical protein